VPKEGRRCKEVGDPSGAGAPASAPDSPHVSSWRSASSRALPSAEPKCQGLEKRYTDSLPPPGQDLVPILDFAWTSGKQFHGDEVLRTRDPQLSSLEVAPDHPILGLGVQSSQASKEIDAIPIGVFEVDQSRGGGSHPGDLGRRPAEQSADPPAEFCRGLQPLRRSHLEDATNRVLRGQVGDLRTHEVMVSRDARAIYDRIRKHSRCALTGNGSATTPPRLRPRSPLP